MLATLLGVAFFACVVMVASVVSDTEILPEAQRTNIFFNLGIANGAKVGRKLRLLRGQLHVHVYCITV